MSPRTRLRRDWQRYGRKSSSSITLASTIIFSSSEATRYALRSLGAGAGHVSALPTVAFTSGSYDSCRNGRHLLEHQTDAVDQDELARLFTDLETFHKAQTPPLPEGATT